MSSLNSVYFDDYYLLVGLATFFGIISIIYFRSLTKRRFNDRKYNKFEKSGSSYPRVFQGAIENLSNSDSKKTSSNFLFDPAKYSLSLIIPAFNEEKRLKHMLSDVFTVLRVKTKRDLNYSAEILLVDDGSKDQTVKEYKRLVSTFENDSRITFKLIKLRTNSGKGKAVSEGALASLGQNILFADADGSTDFECLNKFEALINDTDDATLICGSRCHLNESEESVVKRSIFRLFFMKAFHLYLWIFGVKTISDTQCGFKMTNRAAARQIFPWIHISGWIFDVEMILLAEWKQIKVHEVPVNWKEMNGTKLRIAVDSIRMAKDLLRIRFNYLLGLWKRG